MSKYIFLYKGPATPMDQITPEQGAEIMQAWGSWIGKTGDALVDIGAPFAEGAAVTDAGKDTSTTDLTGYSIVEAANLQAAKALTQGHPFLSEGKGNFTLEIFELAPIPM